MKEALPSTHCTLVSPKADSFLKLPPVQYSQEIVSYGNEGASLIYPEILLISVPRSDNGPIAHFFHCGMYHMASDFVVWIQLGLSFISVDLSYIPWYFPRFRSTSFFKITLMV